MGPPHENGFTLLHATPVQFRTLTNGAGAANVGWEQGQDRETRDHYDHFSAKWKEYFFSMADRSSNSVMSQVEELGRWREIFSTSSAARGGKTKEDVLDDAVLDKEANKTEEPKRLLLDEVGEEEEGVVKNGIYVHRGCQFGGFVENFWHWFYELIVPFYIQKRAMGWSRMLVVWYGYAHNELQIWRDDKLDESLILTELQYRVAADLGLYFEISKAGPESFKNHLKQNRVCVTSKKAGDNVGLPGTGVADYLNSNDTSARIMPFHTQIETYRIGGPLGPTQRF